jgi:hypothetical protein
MARGIGGVAVLGEVLLSHVDADNPTHSFEVTDKAVEDGRSIADHMKERPPTLSISGTILGEDAWPRLARIRKYQTDKELVTYTNRTIYSGMAITNVDTSHSGATANGLRFNITLKHVRRAAPAVVELTAVPPALATKAAPTQNAGTRQPQSTSRQADDNARLLAVADTYRGGGAGGGIFMPVQIAD